MKIEIWHVINVDNEEDYDYPDPTAYVNSFLTKKEAEQFLEEQENLPCSLRRGFSFIRIGEIELPFKISEMD